MNKDIPPFVEPCFWSDDVAKLDLEQHKRHIIKQVLDYGSSRATDWLRVTYSASDIADTIIGTPASAWTRKSLALWSLVYGVSPSHTRRFASV